MTVEIPSAYCVFRDVILPPKPGFTDSTVDVRIIPLRHRQQSRFQRKDWFSQSNQRFRGCPPTAFDASVSWLKRQGRCESTIPIDLPRSSSGGISQNPGIISVICVPGFSLPEQSIWPRVVSSDVPWQREAGCSFQSFHPVFVNSTAHF